MFMEDVESFKNKTKKLPLVEKKSNKKKEKYH